MKTLRAVLFTLTYAVMVWLPLVMRAETITVTLSIPNADAINVATGLGLLDGPVSVTFVGNVAQVIGSPQFYQLSSFSSARLFVGGQGTFAITDPDLFVYVNQDFPSLETGLATGYAGFQDSDNGNAGLYISVHNDAFETFALSSNIGPYTSNSEMDGTEYVNTTDGQFMLDSSQFTNVMYTASVMGGAPEPSSLVLLGTGMAGLGGVLRRRFVRR